MAGFLVAISTDARFVHVVYFKVSSRYFPSTCFLLLDLSVPSWNALQGAVLKEHLRAICFLQRMLGITREHKRWLIRRWNDWREYQSTPSLCDRRVSILVRLPIQLVSMFLWDSVSGASGTIVTSPLEFLKTRLQVERYLWRLWRCKFVYLIYIVNDWSKVCSWLHWTKCDQCST